MVIIKYSKSVVVALVFLIISLTASAQPDSMKINYFTVPYLESDTIECVKISIDDTSKPVIVFLAGSAPSPIVVQDENGAMVIPLNNFDFKQLLSDYNIVLFSHPYIPVVTSYKEVNDKLNYFPNPKQPKSLEEAYLNSNHLDNHIARGNTVVSYLKQQPWVDIDKIILLGHSQGAHVAANMAMKNSDIYAVGYFSGSPIGRFSKMILTERENARQGRAPHDAVQNYINSLYEVWGAMCSGDYPETQGADKNRTWTSFSKCYINEMSDISANLFITYGTEDSGAQICDLLPIFLELGDKQNYDILPFVGRGHNFELVTDGVSNFEDMLWQEAIDGFINWLHSLEKIE